MLKLLKYEWKACARICLPLYGGVLLLSLINNLMMAEPAQQLLYGIPTMLVSMLYFGVMVAVLVVTTVILIQRFYKSLLGDEGYLMFTLPVTVSQHIWSKALVALVMSVLSMLAAVLSISLMAGGLGEMFEWIAAFFKSFVSAFTTDVNTVLYTLEGILWLLLLGVSGVLFIYLCMALGHLAKKHRVLMAVVWYFVLTTAMQFVLMLVLMGAGNLPFDTFWVAVTDFLRGIGPTASIHLGMVVLCVVTAAAGTAFFAGTRFILKNRLNLE
ncbi:MAG: hypothetical protein ACOYIE_09400 [Agathobaculum sp.]|jgi:hypothetical protein|uniref:hypothetical protein n=1 Tax=Agathobaculum sp. TaxID=2048138 RepID=UPI003D942CE4